MESEGELYPIDNEFELLLEELEEKMMRFSRIEKLFKRITCGSIFLALGRKDLMQGFAKEVHVFWGGKTQATPVEVGRKGASNSEALG